MAVTPYSSALFTTSYLCAGVRNEYNLWALLAIFFISASLTFTFTATIAAGGTISLNGPLGSGRSGFSLKGPRKVFQDTHRVCFCPVNFLVIDYLQFLNEIWMGKSLVNCFVFAKFTKVFPRHHFALYGIQIFYKYFDINY